MENLNTMYLKSQKDFYAKFEDKDSERFKVGMYVKSCGGKDAVVSTLREQKEDELADYVENIFKNTPQQKSEIVRSVGKVVGTDENGKEIAVKDGNVYKIDTVKKTMKRVYKDLSSIDIADLELPKMSLQVYKRYLDDHFDGENAKLVKGKLWFRNCRISCDAENGFIIEDSTKHYEILETPFEGIPTPKELGDWFKQPTIEHTPEELSAAVERGKKLQEERKQSLIPEEIDYEKLRKKVLTTIKNIRSKTVDFDPTNFPDMIPFKRWQKKVKSLITDWKSRKIRYKKFIDSVEHITIDETFEVKQKDTKKRYTFTGTILPDFKKVGLLYGDKIEVDGKMIDAVPFLLDYLLHYEEKAMYQIMKFAAGKITENQLLKNPIEVDKEIEYRRNLLPNTPRNAQLLGMIYAQVDVVAPQDLLYTDELKVGDKILLVMSDGKLSTRTITSTDDGIEYGNGIGLYKLDKWVKIEK